MKKECCSVCLLNMNAGLEMYNISVLGTPMIENCIQGGATYSHCKNLDTILQKKTIAEGRGQRIRYRLSKNLFQDMFSDFSPLQRSPSCD
jgi:hypothetical protein